VNQADGYGRSAAGEYRCACGRAAATGDVDDGHVEGSSVRPAAGKRSIDEELQKSDDLDATRSRCASGWAWSADVVVNGNRHQRVARGDVAIGERPSQRMVASDLNLERVRQGSRNTAIEDVLAGAAVLVNQALHASL